MPELDGVSDDPDTLDEDLIRLGISPHPRVVLALEGETEMYLCTSAHLRRKYLISPLYAILSTLSLWRAIGLQSGGQSTFAGWLAMLARIQGDLPDCCDRFADKPLMSRLGSALTWHRLHRVFLSFDPQIVQYLWQS